MKKLILAICVVILSATYSFAQQGQIPHHVMDAFKQAHPMAFQAMWSNDGANYKVGYFDESKMQHFKVYNDNEQLISHTYEVVAGNIPAPIHDYYKKLDAIEGSYKVWTVIDNSGKTSFSVEYNNAITNFDESGKVIK